MIEHYISDKVLRLETNNIYVDVASENSPFPKMYRKKLGIMAYSQDITYKPGVRGFRDLVQAREKMPLKDESVDKISLHCAFEHFQGDIDRKFIQEVSRVLKKGGNGIIVPLYLGNEHLNIVDPLLCGLQEN